MTNLELKKKISEAKNIEWFENVKVVFNFPHIDFVYSLKGISAIYAFVNQQLLGWEKFEDSMLNELIQSKTYFTNLKSQIILFVNKYIDQDDTCLTSNWEKVNNLINNINQNIFTYDQHETYFLINNQKEVPSKIAEILLLLENAESYTIERLKVSSEFIDMVRYMLPREYVRIEIKEIAFQNFVSDINQDVPIYSDYSDFDSFDDLLGTYQKMWLFEDYKQISAKEDVKIEKSDYIDYTDPDDIEF